VTAKRTRANGEGSIFPYRNGYAAHAWVNKPDGRRGRKYVYGRIREKVHDKWIKLQGQEKRVRFRRSSHRGGLFGTLAA
jgi:hypothetical protein